MEGRDGGRGRMSAIYVMLLPFPPGVNGINNNMAASLMEEVNVYTMRLKVALLQFIGWEYISSVLEDSESGMDCFRYDGADGDRSMLGGEV
ncbi:hypothetical protein Tco_1458183 [Tanacetum coccineum]